MDSSRLSLGCALAAGAIAFMAGQVQAYDGKQVNAKAVSVKWRQVGWEDAAHAECGDGDFFTDGSICFYTIQNARVVHEDTIHDRHNGLAVCPVFDLTGTRVAFYREGRAPAATGYSCVQINGGKSYVSVIKTDGTGLRDLCELPATPSNGEHYPLDWPAGEWIYYVNPRAVSSDNLSEDIWKVNAQTGASQRVCQYSSGGCGFRRFTLNLAATHMGVQRVNGCGGNSIYAFPGGCSMNTVCSRPACNIAISPSGQLVGSYFAGYHDDLFINWGVGTANEPCVLGVATPNLNRDLEAWAGAELGTGCEHIRWAVNSDKWVLQSVGWEGHAASLTMGSNQVVCNWIDKVAINISRNPRTASGVVLRFNNCTGDMWIDDPVNNPNANRYEDLQGAWHTVDGATIIDSGRRPAGRIPAGDISATATGEILISLRSQDAAAVSVLDLHGKTIRRLTGSGMVSTGALPAGSYVVKVADANRIRTASVVVR